VLTKGLVCARIAAAGQGDEAGWKPEEHERRRAGWQTTLHHAVAAAARRTTAHSPEAELIASWTFPSDCYQ